MAYGLVQTVAPVVEPITLTEAKLHLRVEVADDDSLITAQITAARQAAEKQTGRQFCTATWQLVLDAFPVSASSLYPGALEVLGWSQADGTIRVPRPRLQSIGSIVYVDTAGASQTLHASLYQVSTAFEPGRITPAYGKSWPATRWQMDAVTITFVSGYGAAAAVPEDLKAAIKLFLGDLYEHREAQSEVRIEENKAVMALLSPYCVPEF